MDLDGSVLKLPCHLTGPQEAPEEAETEGVGVGREWGEEGAEAGRSQ